MGVVLSPVDILGEAVHKRIICEGFIMSSQLKWLILKGSSVLSFLPVLSLRIEKGNGKDIILHLEN